MQEADKILEPEARRASTKFPWWIIVGNQRDHGFSRSSLPDKTVSKSEVHCSNHLFWMISCRDRTDVESAKGSMLSTSGSQWLCQQSALLHRIIRGLPWSPDPSKSCEQHLPSLRGLENISVDGIFKQPCWLVCIRFYVFVCKYSNLAWWSPICLACTLQLTQDPWRPLSRASQLSVWRSKEAEHGSLKPVWSSSVMHCGWRLWPFVVEQVCLLP